MTICRLSLHYGNKESRKNLLLRGENRSTRRKTRLRAEWRTNKPNTYDAESGNRNQATVVRGECSHMYVTNALHIRKKLLLPKAQNLLRHMFDSQGNSILSHHCLPSRRMRRNKHTLVVFQTEDSLFLKGVQLERPLQIQKG